MMTNTDARKRNAAKTAADHPTQEAPGVGLSEEERALLEVATALYGWATQSEALEATTKAVERIVAARVAEALREASDEHERELVCCDIYERLKDKPTAGWTDAERREQAHHSICYWGAACAEADRDRADRIETDQ